LASEEPMLAFRASWSLASQPRESTSFIKERLRPIASATPAAIRRLIADLDNELFDRREKASKRLASLGIQVEPELRKALARKPSPEMIERIKILLKPIDSPIVLDHNRLQTLRAIAVLGRIGTPAARKVLENMAQGAPLDTVTKESKAILKSLHTRMRR
jgi:hypothetical protein